MSIKSSLEIVQKFTQLYLTGFSLNSIYNSTYLNTLQEASSIKSKPTEENNYYDEWLSFSAKELEIKLKSREFTSLLSQYINSLVELRTILIGEDIRDYSQLGGLKKEQDRLQQQIYMFNMFIASKQQPIMSLIRLQSMDISEDQILNMDRFLQQYNGQQHVQQSTP